MCRYWFFCFVAIRATAASGPVLSSVNVFGTQGGTPIQAIATDASGNIYITGTTRQAIPLVNPIKSTLGTGNCSTEPSHTFVPCEDVFVAKFDPTGKILFSTYVGGNERDFASGIAVDQGGNIYLSGTIAPVAPAFVQSTPAGQAFVMKLNPTGSAILYAHYINSLTTGSAIAVDSQGNAYLAGTSSDLNFPAVNALQAQAPIKSLLATKDGGSTWQALNNGLRTLSVRSLAINPNDRNTMYAATSSGLFKTGDGGASWTPLLPAAKVAQQVILDPRTPATVYVTYGDSSGFTQQFAKSSDAGATWQVLTSALPQNAPVTLPINDLAIDLSNPAVLWMALTSPGGAEIAKSTDGGLHWTDVHDFPASFIGPSLATDVGGIVIDPTNSSRVYVCCAYQIGVSLSAVYRTDDGGKTWTLGGSAPTSGSLGVSVSVIDPRSPSTLYAAWYGGLVRSTDVGATWSSVSLPPGAPQSGYEPAVIDSVGLLYLINDSGVLLRSPDGGSTWTTTRGPWSTGARLLALDPVNPSAVIYVGAPGTAGFIAPIKHAFAAKLDPNGNVVWATLLAGAQQDEARAIAVDSAGNAYIAGQTNSYDFPLANPLQAARALTAYPGPGFDAFVSEISSDGTRLIYSTYLGGSGEDAANTIAVDSAGNAYLAGSTLSTDFPTANGFEPHAPSLDGGPFVAKVSPAGRSLVYSTYLNGSGYAFGNAATAIAVDAQDAVWVAGQTSTSDFPLVNPIQSSIGVPGTSFIAKLNPSGKTLDFSTYFGGSSGDVTTAVALGPNSILFAGSANSVDFPVATPPAGPYYAAAGFFAKLDLAPPPPQPGVPLITAIYNAASYRIGDVVSPNEIVALMGAELAPATGQATAFPLPQSLQGVTVTIGGIPAPLFYVSPSQINFQVPPNLPLGAASLVVTRGSQTSTIRTLRVIAATPGIFTLSGDGRTAPAVVHASNYQPVTAQNPAHAGEYLIAFCTGLGVTNVNVDAGAAAPPQPAPIQTSFQLTLNGQPDSAITGLLYAGLAPGFAGLYQVNFQLGARATSPGNLFIRLGNGTFTNQVLVYVQ
jgi:uncharacterized protein (TIGR03437 family)